MMVQINLDIYVDPLKIDAVKVTETETFGTIRSYKVLVGGHWLEGERCYPFDVNKYVKGK